MSAIPSFSSSILNALQSGYARFDKGAQELVQGQDPGQTMDESAGQEGVEGVATDPMIAGVGDLLLGEMQVRVGALMLRKYAGGLGGIADFYA